jgi:predicted RNA-binding Zn ribbon-like protein
MATSRTRISARVRELRFDAGSPSLNLIATVARRPSTPIERLGDLDRLRAFTDGIGVTLADEACAAEFLQALWTFRSAAYEVLSATMNGRAPQPDALALINKTALINLPVPQLRATAGTVGVLDSGPLTGSQLLAFLARDLIAVVSGQADHLQTCDADVCQMIYLQAPGGRPRKWCSMQRCGNAAKAAQHRRLKQELAISE